MNGLFSKVFGGKGEDKVRQKQTAEDKTGMALKQLQDKMDFCQKKLAELQRQADEKTEEIKASMTKGQREKAKLLLKRKKIIEKQILAVQNNHDRLMEQQIQLDMSQSNIMTVQALAEAADAGKANLKANDLENVEEVLDDIADQNTQMSQIQDSLAMPTGMMADLDGEDLDNELAEMEQMMQEDELGDIAVPSTTVPGVATPATAQTAAPQRVALGADGLPAAPSGAAMPSAPSHKAEMTAEDKELEALMKMAGQ